MTGFRKPSVSTEMDKKKRAGEHVDLNPKCLAIKEIDASTPRNMRIGTAKGTGGFYLSFC